MFEHKMIEQEGVVKITDLSHEIMEEMLLYIYTEEIPKIDELAFELLPAADKYQLEDLKDRCEKKLINVLLEENVIQMLILSDMHNAKKLKKEALAYIKK